MWVAYALFEFTNCPGNSKIAFLIKSKRFNEVHIVAEWHWHWVIDFAWCLEKLAEDALRRYFVYLNIVIMISKNKVTFHFEQYCVSIFLWPNHSPQLINKICHPLIYLLIMVIYMFFFHIHCISIFFLNMVSTLSKYLDVHKYLDVIHLRSIQIISSHFI